MNENENPRLAVGELAPQFCLPDQDEKLICLKDLHGQTVILYFYPKDMTPGCTTEACDFNDRLDRISPYATVIGISPDTPESHRRFRNNYGLGFPLLSDPTLETIKAYGAYGTKMNYGKTIQGIIRSTFLISPDGQIVQAMYNVKATGHAERVLAQLI
ncbi:MAG: peroxiredoxin [Acidimicrobiaceae bacterium]|nr:peroxiredoxin [Acidimicrobiaceae bacterium]